MAIRVQTEFTRKGDVRIIYYNYDDDEALVTATEVLVSVVAPDGEVVEDETEMVEGDTGVYEYYYATTVTTLEGDYQIEVDSTDGGKHSFYSYHFTLEAGINE